MPTENINKIPELIKELYSITDQLEELFNGRPFTLDGHLVGSIGEVLAAYHYDLELLEPSAKTHDAKDKNGTMVQIKATQVNKVALRSEPEHLIVLKIGRDGIDKEVYNGPGDTAWNNVGKMQKNGQRSISIPKLEKLMKEVSLKKRLAIKNPFPSP
jgi:hypothetical protein